MCFGMITRQAAIRPEPSRFPFALRDVLQEDGHQHERALSVGKRADDPRSPPDLPVLPLDGVVRADSPPVLHGKPRVGGRLRHAVTHALGGLPRLHALERRGDRLRLFHAGAEGLPGMDRFEHLGDQTAPGPGGLGERVAVEVHGTPLVGRIREHLGYRPRHGGRLVARKHTNAAKAVVPEPREKLAPASEGFGESPRCPHDLSVPVIPHACRHHDGHALERPAPGPLQVDAVDEDIGIAAREQA